ncbi:MAG TPA: DUF3658 domain-containing protein [Reyranella sp.]|nr:DUF3658 domain-containing protein [Reyranella sp.]
MRALHVAPGNSAGGSLLQAIREARRNEEVVSCPDDLSCGPIESDEQSARAAWWARFYDVPEFEGDFKTFWNRVTTTDDRIVVWFGRHSASELAFFLALADRLGDRSYDIVDVTGPRSPAVSIVPTDRLRPLLETERPITGQEGEAACRYWRQLRVENAPFRVVTPTGLVSAPVDHFDPLLIERATPEWRKIARVVGDTMGYNFEPYMQVGDMMLLARVVALVSEGKLLADGDPWDMRSCRVRLPG